MTHSANHVFIPLTSLKIGPWSLIWQSASQKYNARKIPSSSLSKISFLSLIYLPPCFFCLAWINFSCVNRNFDSKFLFFSITFSRIVSFDSPASLSFKISSLRTVFNLRLINDAVQRIEVSAIKWGVSYRWSFCPWSAWAVWRRRPSRRRSPL